MIEIELDMSDESKALLKKMPELTVPALFKGMKRAMLLVESTAKTPYLTGKALNVQTGHLRRSVATKVEIRGNKVTGRIGTNLSYGRFWELGYDGPMKVKAHARTIRQAFGRPIAPKKVHVKAHTRQVSVSPRPFLRPAVEDNVDKIRKILARHIEEAFSRVD